MPEPPNFDLEQLREYDSLVSLTKRCSPRSQTSDGLICFTSNEQYLVFGWNTGVISILHRNSPGKPYYIRLPAYRPASFFSRTTQCQPIHLAIRVATSLVVMVCCLYNSKSKSIEAPGPSATERIRIHIYQIPRSSNGSLNISKVLRHTLTRHHHSMPSAAPFVSANGEFLITSDESGIIVASKFDGQKYTSSVLGVIPASVEDIQSQSALLLITGRQFLRWADPTDSDLVEFFPTPEPTIFLFNISSKYQSQLDLDSVLPRNLKLKISCARPAWLLKQAYSKCQHFVCTVTRTASASTMTGFPLAAIFAVDDSMSVTLHRIIISEPGIEGMASVPRISVLPSIISTSHHESLDNFLTDPVEKSLYALSFSTLLLWYTSKNTASAAPGRSSVLVLVQLSTDAYQHGTDLMSRANLIRYSDRLGQIRSVCPVWLKPRLGPIDHIPSEVVPTPGGLRSNGLEIWIHRSVPSSSVSPLLLLSTRPLCASKVAVSPSADLASLFIDPPSRPYGRAISAPNFDGITSRSRPSFDPMRPCPFNRSSVTTPTRTSTVSSPTELLADPGFEVGIEVIDEFLSGGGSWSAIETSSTEVNHPESDTHDPSCSTSDAPRQAEEPETQANGIERSPFAVLDNQQTSSHERIFVQPTHGMLDRNTLDEDVLRHITPSDQLDFDGVISQSQTQDFSYTIPDTWSFYRCPQSRPSEPITSEQLSNLLECATAETVPLVLGGNCAVIAVVVPSSHEPVWIFSPPSFGAVHSLHISPNGSVVWCLRQKPKSSERGFSVDVLSESTGVTGLLYCWLSGHEGRWERDVLLRVTSLDLHNTFAIFSSASGLVKLQLGLSCRRPYCQSFTWPNPDYHVLQVAATESGIVWALAVSKHANNDSIDLSMDELCLLTASLPSTSKESDVQGFSVARRLRPSSWHPLLLPAQLQHSTERLVHGASSLELLTDHVNATFQLFFSPQLTADQSDELYIGWLFVSTHCLDTTSATTLTSAFFLPNLQTSHKPDDLNWYQVSVGDFQGTSSNSAISQSLVKWFNRGGNGSSSISRPFFRVSRSVLVNPMRPFDGSIPKLTTHRPWFLIDRPPPTPSLLASPRNSLCAYQWLKYHPRLPNQPRSGSPLPADVVCCAHFWRYPCIVSYSGRDDLATASIWMVNMTTNELCLYMGSDCSHSLALPDGIETSDQVTSLCAVNHPHLGSLHLLVATRSGQLWSRLHLSNSTLTGMSWFKEICPAEWLQCAPSNRPFFTSLTCASDGQLWATDSNGHLITAQLVQITCAESYMQHLIDQWLPSSESTQSNILFLSVSGVTSPDPQATTPLWAVGLPNTPANRGKLTDHMTSVPSMDTYLGGLVYTRCWNPVEACHYWLHVESPAVRSLHVNQHHAWILTATHTPDLYIRLMGQPINTEDHLDHTIGHPWQLVPQPDPLSHTINLASFALAPNHPLQLDDRMIDAIFISALGDFLTLSLHSTRIMFSHGLPSLDFSISSLGLVDGSGSE